jgi:TPR repeat protein
MSSVKSILGAALILALSPSALLAQAADVNGGLSAKKAGRVEDTRLQPDHFQDMSEAEGEDLRLAGHCDRAVPILRGWATRGAGNEIAQYNLGLCLLDLAAAKGDAQAKAGMQKEGAQWIVQAANGKLAKAQAEAAKIYLDGIGVPADPVEAEKWALLFHDNGLRLSLGLPDLSRDMKDRLDAALTEAQRNQARSRAESWSSAAD